MALGHILRCRTPLNRCLQQWNNNRAYQHFSGLQQLVGIRSAPRLCLSQEKSNPVCTQSRSLCLSRTLHQEGPNNPLEPTAHAKAKSSNFKTVLGAPGDENKNLLLCVVVGAALSAKILNDRYAIHQGEKEKVLALTTANVQRGKHFIAKEQQPPHTLKKSAMLTPVSVSCKRNVDRSFKSSPFPPVVEKRLSGKGILIDKSSDKHYIIHVGKSHKESGLSSVGTLSRDANETVSSDTSPGHARSNNGNSFCPDKEPSLPTAKSVYDELIRAAKSAMSLEGITSRVTSPERKKLDVTTPESKMVHSNRQRIENDTPTKQRAYSRAHVNDRQSIRSCEQSPYTTIKRPGRVSHRGISSSNNHPASANRVIRPNKILLRVDANKTNNHTTRKQSPSISRQDNQMSGKVFEGKKHPRSAVSVPLPGKKHPGIMASPNLKILYKSPKIAA